MGPLTLRNIFLTIVVVLSATIIRSQCNQYFIYESFSTSLPTQRGTWINTSVLYGTTTSTARTGSNYLTFNAVNDAIRLPQITNPGVLSFYYRRSSTSTGTPKFSVETSPNGSTWTERLAVTSFSTTYALASVNLGSLGLTNVHIRVIDRRASGSAERYIDDLSLTSVDASENTFIPFITSCTQTVNSNYTYIVSDNISPDGPIIGNYTNNLDRVMTFTPDDNTKKLILTFDHLDLETDYDYLYIHDGANTSANLLATLTGTTNPGEIVSTNPTGQLTLRWTTDVSNVGSWGGFRASMTSVTPLPVELLYFEGIADPTFNMLKWATASEKDASHFVINRSIDGEFWISIGERAAAGNSNETQNYSYLDAFKDFGIHYYQLTQYDIDGKYEIFGPIAIDNSRKIKKIVKWINMAGQEVGPEFRGILFEIYEDGTSKKIIR
jgi:hypothetical protein